MTYPPEMLTGWHLWSAGFLGGLAGDAAARCAAADFHEERDPMTPFEVGQCYLIQTVTLYYVGRVAKVQGGFVELEDASWVHWTGRLSTLTRKFAFTGFPSNEQRPRTEYVGRAGISLAAVVTYLPGEWDLPKESVR